MKKFLLSLVTVAAFAVYIVMTKNSDLAYVAPTTPTAGNAPTIVALPAAHPQPTPAPAAPPPVTPPPPKQSKIYNDGTYVGDVADAYYGYVQVEATIQNDKITDVQFLQYPSDRSTSRYINGQAMPYLIQEALQAQSAQVDIVSGATATSGAFQESLASALTQARQ